MGFAVPRGHIYFNPEWEPDMGIFEWIALFWEVLKLIMSLRGTERRIALNRLRNARRKAQQTGDTSELEKLRDDLLGR